MNVMRGNLHPFHRAAGAGGIIGIIGIAAILLFAAFWLASAPPASAAEWKAPPEANGYKNPAKKDAQSIAAGLKVYQKYCALCHGEKGNGEGPSSRTLQIKPASFQDQARMNGQSDGVLAWKILNGRGPMPSWAPVLSEDDIWNVINYLREFSK